MGHGVAAVAAELRSTSDQEAVGHGVVHECVLPARQYIIWSVECPTGVVDSRSAGAQMDDCKYALIY
jgi:hypothetical protein